MNTVLNGRIVKIGNSRGIRIPALLLEQLGLKEKDQIEIEVCADQLVIRPAPKRARQGWEEQFAAMAANGDDALLDADASLSSWDEEEWEW